MKTRHSGIEIQSSAIEYRYNTQVDERRLVELIREHSAEQAASKMELSVDLSKDELISEIQKKIEELQQTTNRILA
jgi:hypothetical protein